MVSFVELVSALQIHASIICCRTSSHPSVEDTVFLMITDCDGDGCDAAVESALFSRNISYLTDCSKLKGLTVAMANKMGMLPGGGSVLAIKGCWQSYYDPSIACSGYGDTVPKVIDIELESGKELEGKTFYTCYSDSSSKALPFERMWHYIGNTTASGPPDDGKMWTLQALWQETAASVAIGELHGSTLLDDEKRSNLNALINARIKGNYFNTSRLNLLELNNVSSLLSPSTHIVQTHP